MQVCKCDNINFDCDGDAYGADADADIIMIVIKIFVIVIVQMKCNQCQLRWQSQVETVSKHPMCNWYMLIADVISLMIMMLMRISTFCDCHSADKLQCKPIANWNYGDYADDDGDADTDGEDDDNTSL